MSASVLNQSLYTALVAQHLRERGNKPAISKGDQTYTYRQTEESIESLARFLEEEYSLKHGDLACVEIGNEPEFLFATLALNRLGAISVGIEPKPEERRRYIIGKTQPKLIITKETIETASARKPKSLSATIDQTESTQANDTAIVIFSSGSTGYPKGVCLSNTHLLRTALNVSDLMLEGSNHKELLIAPLNHTDGWQRAAATLLLGGEVRLFDDLLSPAVICDWVARHGIRGLYCPPPLVEPLTRFLTSRKNILQSTKLMHIEIGSAKFRSSLIEDLRSAIKPLQLIVHYGLTECSRASFFNASDAYSGTLESIGTSSNGCELKIVDELGTCAKTNEMGEIAVRGEQCSTLYWPGTTEKPSVTNDAEEWFYTGDYGFQDQNGLFYFTGRRDDLITSNGFHFYPSEVETAIGNLDGVSEYKVCRLITEKQEYPILFAAAKETVETKQKLLQTLRERVPGYMIPRQIHFIDTLPRTPSGKVDSKKLLEGININAI